MSGHASRGEMVVAGLTIVIAVLYIFLNHNNSNAEKMKSTLKKNTAPRYKVIVHKKAKLPRTDIFDSHDFNEVGRPPRSKIVWRQQTKLMGLGSKTVKYTTFSSPEELQRYFTDKLGDKYAIIRDDLTSDNGMGWNGLFLDPEVDELIAIFSTSRRLDRPPGGLENPSSVSVMKVENLKDVKR
ncbi:MAG TPA: hypothetical protein ENH19_02865 [Actinobacteria bacterium]|nr:hypothetical protein [Actinomycetes bacterium]HEX21577.1 hypothetical protein [Actinomycetota bacterium]